MDSQLNLFPSEEEHKTPVVVNIEEILGLKRIDNFISTQEETKLLSKIDKQDWLTDLNRRVQHYGYKYDYRTRRIDNSMKLGNIPEWAESIALRLKEQDIFPAPPDQLIINEYISGQGISPHIDCEPCFGDTIVSISLGSTVIMNFTHPMKNVTIPIFLPRRSAVILKEDSRYVWKHSIPARKSDVYKDTKYPRRRRVSLTFRKVTL